MLSAEKSLKQYHYTKSNAYLSDEQRDFYEENGYLVVRNLVDYKTLDDCRQRFLDVLERKVPKGRIFTINDRYLKKRNAEGEFLVNKMECFAYDEVLFKYVSYKPIIDIVESIIGPNITSAHTMLLNKPPHSDKDTSKHPVHQDLFYFPYRPLSCMTTSWTAMERADEQNGCLFVLPGSHKANRIYEHNYPDAKSKNVGYFEAFGFEEAPRVDIVMEKGDTIFFHPLLLHGSGSNITNGFRKAISSMYVDTNRRFFDVQGTIQEKVKHIIEQQVISARGLSTMSYMDYWGYLSRLVKGEANTFTAA